jgi:hypothetical protein
VKFQTPNNSGHQDAKAPRNILPGDHGVHEGFKKKLHVLHELPVKNPSRLRVFVAGVNWILEFGVWNFLQGGLA